jgi:hypothetical protein
MIRWALLTICTAFLMEMSVAAQSSAVFSDPEKAAKSALGSQKKTKHKKKKAKHHKKKHKAKKKRSKRKKEKHRIYSQHKIEQLFSGNHNGDRCTRINCASKLDIARSCLQTKANRRYNKQCYRAFCAYGCNDEDYATKPDLKKYCNKICASRKYGKKLH